MAIYSEYLTQSIRSTIRIIPVDERNCYYCLQYAKLIDDYPINTSSFSTDPITPRCELHAQYTCDSCKRKYHFNGIGFCQNCSLFTCLRCTTDLSVIEYTFMIYNYYCQLKCANCEGLITALDYAEFQLTHPMQIGVIQPQNIKLWVPTKVSYPTKEYTGFDRLEELVPIKGERLDNYDESIVEETWTKLADIWSENVLKGDPHHEIIIIPALFSMLKLTGSEVVLDIACGQGNVTRKLAPQVKEITGLDISGPFIKLARELEQENSLGIRYIHQSAEDLSNLGEEAYDLVTCNMGLMDMVNLDKVLQNVYRILKPGGQFAFTISHPAFAWPGTATIKLPNDSQRNEDRTRIFQDYFDTRPMFVDMPDSPLVFLTFPRPVSTYVNSLLDIGFTLKRMIEPKIDEETAKQYPRVFHREHTLVPYFLAMLVEK